eukprot:14505365-Alexandrium_andersonii.AAC.1
MHNYPVRALSSIARGPSEGGCDKALKGLCGAGTRPAHRLKASCTDFTNMLVLACWPGQCKSG